MFTLSEKMRCSMFLPEIGSSARLDVPDVFFSHQPAKEKVGLIYEHG